MNLIEVRTNREFTVVRHGLTQARCASLLGRARVLWGDYPDICEITGDRVATTEALAGISTLGAYYTRFASLYRSGRDPLLLVEFIR